MSHHLTERELIEYQFRLISEAETEPIGAHLEVCSECREHLEQLKHKFTALDLLRGDIVVSEDLLSRVTEQAAQPVQRRVIPFTNPAWIATAAAVLIVGLALLLASLTEKESTRRHFAKGPVPADETPHPELEVEKGSEVLTVAKKFDERMEVPPVAELDTKDAAGRTLALGMPKEETPMREYFHGAITPGGTRSALPEQISEQPPFAPASAIELVTLPRRDKVQLTIYNSADLTLVRERRNLTLKIPWYAVQVENISSILCEVADHKRIGTHLLRRPSASSCERMQGCIGRIDSRTRMGATACSSESGCRRTSECSLHWPEVVTAGSRCTRSGHLLSESTAD